MSDLEMNICPVCGYDKLRRPPENHLICPCCGTQFEYDDCSRSHAELRADWIIDGCQWFSRVTAPPSDWNGRDQLVKAGFTFAVTAPKKGKYR